MVCDLEDGRRDYIADDRKQQSLDGHFESISDDERDRIEAVAMDMWEPYLNSVRAHLFEALNKIVFDRFHVMCHMGDTLDTVRKREHREMAALGMPILVGSEYLWLYAEENLPECHHERFAALKTANLKTARAWAIKESLRLLWGYVRRWWPSGSGDAGTSGPPTAACGP